jgi:predicted nucleic acid-binding protein
LLFDTNVWLYLYPAPAASVYRHAARYSSGLKSMLQAGAQMVVDAVVLSEYLNRYCRIEWSANHRAMYRDFKAFRMSADFAPAGQAAAAYANQILKLGKRYDHPFSLIDLMRILTDFESGLCDFNDGLLVETCRHHGWKIVTNDSDFVSGGIEVLTTNPKLLKACP